MEEQAATELVDALLSKLSACRELILGRDISLEKERRQFPTNLLYMPGYAGAPRDAAEYDDCPSWLCTRGCSHVIDSLILLLTRDLARVDYQLRVKPSQKSRKSGQGLPHYDYIKRTARQLTRCGVMPVLREIFEHNGALDIYESAVGGTVYRNLFVQDLLFLLSGRDVPLTSEWLELRAAWPIGSNLRFNTKLYLSRLERRTFAGDKDVLRSLLGSILHALLSPVGKKDHHRPFSFSAPPMGKNILDLNFTLAANSEYTMVFGDISSFTASFSNMWVILLELIHVLEVRGIEKKIVVDVGGSLIETELVEVLRLFVYMGAGAGVEAGDELFFPKGAILGVAGVDTLAKATFALILESICASVPEVTTARPRAAGDDFYIGLVTRCSKPETITAALDYLREEIGGVVGRLKILEYETLQRPPVDYVSSATFCKKRLRVVSERELNGRRRVKIMSQWPLPMLGALIERPTGPDHSAAGVWNAIRRGVPWVPENELLNGIMFGLYAEDGDTDLPLSKTVQSTELGVDLVDGFTPGALELLSKVDPILDSDGCAYRLTFRSRVSAIASGRLESLKVSTEGVLGFIIARRGELRPDTFEISAELPPRNTEPHKELSEAYRALGQLARDLKLKV